MATILPKHRRLDYNGLEIEASYFTGAVNGDIVATDLVAVSALTDSTAGTPSLTVVAAIPAAVNSAGADTTAATTVSVNASLAAIRNDLSTLTAKVNVILAALK